MTVTLLLLLTVWHQWCWPHWRWWLFIIRSWCGEAAWWRCISFILFILFVHICYFTSIHFTFIFDCYLRCDQWPTLLWYQWPFAYLYLWHLVIFTFHWPFVVWYRYPLMLFILVHLQWYLLLLLFSIDLTHLFIGNLISVPIPVICVVIVLIDLFIGIWYLLFLPHMTSDIVWSFVSQWPQYWLKLTLTLFVGSSPNWWPFPRRR